VVRAEGARRPASPEGEVGSAGRVRARRGGRRVWRVK